MPSSAATLSIVATPIGNLDDMSARAREVLAAADVIAAEDTRHSRRLMSHLGVGTPLISLHEHNESARIDQIIERLAAGEHVALISDAGTPLISDPGYALVAAVRAAGHAVVAVPGPCAVIAALSVAGLPTDRFVFEGFLPSKPGARRARLEALAEEPRTVVCYESSHRIVATAADLAERFGMRQLVLARELTKLHEQSVALAAAELPAWLAADDNRRRGEFVLVIAGAPEPQSRPREISLDALLAELLPLAGTKKAATIAARLTGTARNAAYQRALELAG
ncbi:16S rRNA (cytidine(1402)-2'-O)-methyltransferase [Salinisphaera hydrothermalis]|uniref:Ribosomal RNA small subunit methyltransferase I n=1 Tax=Salinisphaera hydrothermalis (strain C41B8) TaxID=1304275 RepID=A0A084IP79_SALHC|nr:16S rRNA (cytidine(1402)-2'-O)-methyltransferase [Salinisphaera hydrothermalis]KEZ78513.1 rRNA small subunit methyltransferase I [Salinisphaera hydrothermalis C41B8]